MVKNELSIKASETRRVANNMQEVQLRKANSKISKELAKLHQQISFNKKENEEALHQARLENLNAEVKALHNANPYDSLELLYSNLRKENLQTWSYVKIDRANLENEKVKAIIARHRHELVKIDNNILKSKLNKEEYAYKFDRDVKFHQEYYKLIEECYKENDVRLEKIPYSEFVTKTKSDYEIKKNIFDKDFEAFYKLIVETINKCYHETSAFSQKEEVFNLATSLESKLKEIKNLSKDIKEYNVDLATLNEQEKEKLDVKEEKDEVISNINKKKEEINSLHNSIKLIHEKIDELIKSINETKKVNLELTNLDEKKKELLEKISLFFENKDKNISSDIFFTIKEYVDNKLVNYSNYYYESYDNYVKENEEYQKNVLASLDEETKKHYAKKEDYLAYLTGTSQSDIEQLTLKLKKESKQEIAKINQDFKEQIRQIKLARKERINEYKKQKANAKIAMKVADAAKSSELKEIVKLYKKEINTGEFNRYVEAFKTKWKNIAKEKASYNLRLTKITKPKAIYAYYKYDVQVKKDKNEYAKKHSSQNKYLRKELSISKYRKNMNVQSRENILGYLFLSIWAIGFIALTLVPIFYTFLLVGSDITYTNQGYSKAIDIVGLFNGGKLFPNWVGWANFETLFLTDIDFLYTYIPRFFRNLLLFVPIVVFISFVLALLLNTKIKGRTLFRVIYFLPVVIVSGPILSLLNDTDNNKTSSITLTLDGSSVATILSSISPKLLQYANEVFQNFIIILWMTGVPIVLFISALQKINRSLYEAADIDGANGWQKLWTITFPLIKSIMLIVCLFTIMQVTTINYSGVNPINSWLTTNMSNYKYSLVALGAWVQTLIVLLFVLVAFLLFREKEFVSKQKSYEEMEAYKKKKQARQAKAYEFFHIGDIKNFFTKLFGPIIKAINVSKEKRRIKKEQEGK